MSEETLNYYSKSLDFYNFESTEDFYGETELNEQQNEYTQQDDLSTDPIVESAEDEHSFIYDSEFELQNSINLIKKINSIEPLRLELANLFHRKSNIMDTLVELFESGLVSSV